MTTIAKTLRFGNDEGSLEVRVSSEGELTLLVTAVSRHSMTADIDRARAMELLDFLDRAHQDGWIGHSKPELEPDPELGTDAEPQAVMERQREYTPPFLRPEGERARSLEGDRCRRCGMDLTKGPYFCPHLDCPRRSHAPREPQDAKPDSPRGRQAADALESTRKPLESSGSGCSGTVAGNTVSVGSIYADAQDNSGRRVPRSA